MPPKTTAHALFASMVFTDSGQLDHFIRSAIAPHPLHIIQQLPKKRMTTQRGRIAHQQQLAPCAGHAHVHAADVRQEADLALGVAARQGDGNDVALLALKRIDRAHVEPALQQRVTTQPSNVLTQRRVLFVAQDGFDSICF